MKLRRLIPLFLALSLCTATLLFSQDSRKATASSSEPRLVVVEDLFKISSVRDPRVSPEGEWVAYTVTTPNLKEEKSETRIWVTPFDGGSKAIPFTADGHSSSRPRWDPSGQYLAFLSARAKGSSQDSSERKTQVWTLFRGGGEAQQLTDIQQGVQSFEWSPDGKKLVLVIRDPSPEETAAAKAKKEDRKYEKPKVPRPYVIDRLQFKQDYAGYLDRRRTHLYVLNVESKELLQVTSGDYDDSAPAWSPDGRFIAFTSNRTEDPDSNFNTDIWIVPSESPDKGKNLIQVTTNLGEDNSPSWSPDGKWITYSSITDAEAIVFGTNHLAVSPYTGGEAKILTRQLDRNISSPQFSRDGEHIYFLLEESGQRHLARVAAPGGEISRQVDGALSVRGLHVARSGKIATVISQPDTPGEIFVLEPGGEPRKLTSTNDQLISKLKLATVEKHRFKSQDGTEIESFYYKPPSFNPELDYPTILLIHGGPISQYDYSFSFQAQLYAAKGYLVVMPNPRGSSGYGQDFSLEIWADWGNKDYQDVMAAVDYAIEQGWADPDRLGVGGWSYGGILTNYVITKTDRFKGAVTGASLALYAANYGHDHYQKWYEKEFGLPWENRELWERLSPYNSVEKIVTPTLIMGGAVDWNVPIINSEQLYIALKRLGRETQLVVYPNEHHGLRKPSNQRDRYERYLAWFDKYVKGEDLSD
jgi:dipeptidyl aminopeptidase/acylaminoacyl peptidase